MTFMTGMRQKSLSWSTEPSVARSASWYFSPTAMLFTMCSTAKPESFYPARHTPNKRGRKVWTITAVRCDCPDTTPTAEGVLIYPSVAGATNWFSPTYSPVDHLFYVSVMEKGHIYYMGEAIYQPGARYTAGGGQNIPGEDPYSLIKAFEPENGQSEVGVSQTARACQGRAALDRGRLGIRVRRRGRFFRA